MNSGSPLMAHSGRVDRCNRLISKGRNEVKAEVFTVYIPLGNKADFRLFRDMSLSFLET